MQITILPSLLAADTGHLADAVKRAEQAGADEIHLDIMDGHFVPNLSMGPDVVKMVSCTTDLPCNVHLMLSNPDQYLDRFIDAGATTLHIHIEPDYDVAGSLDHIRSCGVKPGITINPETPPEALWPVLGKVDEVLCMTVHPGYGGQSFMPDVLPKIRAIRERVKEQGSNITIMVDGGISTDTAADCAAAGANSFVAGTFLYRATDMASTIAAMRAATQQAFVE